MMTRDGSCPGAELEMDSGCQWRAVLAEAEGGIPTGTVPQGKIMSKRKLKKKKVLKKQLGKEKVLSLQILM